MTGPQRKPVNRPGVRRRRPGPAIRPPRFNGQNPPRWFLRRVGPNHSALVIVDEKGIRVLEHWDPGERRSALHLAKAAPVMAWALVHAYESVDGFMREFAPRPTALDHTLRIMAEAVRETLPWRDPLGTRLLVNLECNSSQGLTEDAA